MSFPRYPEYKDSGVEWLGVVPEHWELKRLKQMTKIVMGQSPSSEECNLDGFGLPFLQGCAEFGSHFPTPKQYCGVATKFASEGDFLFSVRAPVGATNIADQKYGIGRGLCAIRSLSIHRTFMRWSIEWNKEQLVAVSTGSTYEAVTVSQVGNVFIALPPLPEQQTIAVFLDRETAKIDALIAEQRRLIELLKEKRQAVISHAVTKGLNPEAKMKDSGIEWLGEVPEHWAMRRLKNISPFITVGIVVNPSEYVAEDGLPFIYGGDITEGKINTNSCRKISEIDSNKNAKTRLETDDLLTVRVGAPGITAVVPEDCAGGNCASVMLTKKGKFNSYWLCHAMNSRMVSYQVQIVQYGAAQEQFNISHAINFWIATPPIDEQSMIVYFLDQETTKLDNLTAEVQRAITLLQERRTALISAAVTGKIDVRSTLDNQENLPCL